MRPRGVVVQLGLGGDISVPFKTSSSLKELSMVGSFRFHAEFELAVHLMRTGLVDLKPLISHTLPLDRAVEAFDTANDRRQAMKVQIAFG